MNVLQKILIGTILAAVALFYSALEAAPVTDTDPSVTGIMELLDGPLTPDRLSLLAHQATAVPVFSSSGSIHSLIIRNFITSNIDNAEYRNFILQSLNNSGMINDTWKAYQVLELLQYLSSDCDINDDEWNAGLSALQRLALPQYLNSFLSELLYPRASYPADPGRIYSRIDQYFRMAEEKKIGGPVPVPMDTAFFEIMEAFHPFSDTDNDNRVLLYCYTRYHQKVTAERRKGTYPYLKNMYAREQDPEARKNILDLLCRYFNESTVELELAKNMMDFAALLKALSRDDPYSSDGSSGPDKHMTAFLNYCGDRLSVSLALITDIDEKKAAALFCLQNSIPCNTIIPQNSEIAAMMASDSSDMKSEALEYLEAMPSGTDIFENNIITMLNKIGPAASPDRTPVICRGIGVLEKLKEPQQETIIFLTGLLKSENLNIAFTASEALIKIGAASVPFLERALDTENDFTRLKIIHSLSKLGHAAGPAREKIRRVIEESPNKWIKEAALDALDKIQ